jgi:predicted ArsR family transcriptional regulator
VALDALAFVEAQYGSQALDQLFAQRRQQLAHQYQPRLKGKDRATQVAELASILNEQGYMCEWSQEGDGSFVLIEHNCPVDCVAREYHQACSNEITLYEELLGTPVTRHETIAEGGTCCRYRIGAE